MGVELYSTRYPNVGDLYRYNTVYSQQLDSTLSYPKPFDFTEDATLGTRVVASRIKINGEYTDNWTVFGANESIEVDPRFGDITLLSSFRNNLFFFQKSAFGILAVNNRSLVQDNNSAAVALGTGGVLERYDYVSEKNGLHKSTDALKTFENIYLIDRVNKSIVSVLSKNDISLLNGIRSGIANILNKTVNITIGYDQIFKEVLFTIGNKTFVFNENTGKFCSKYSTAPTKFFSAKDRLLSYITYEDTAGTDRFIYEHNKGKHGDVYPESLVNNKSIIELDIIANPYGHESVIFDVLEFKTESYSDVFLVDKIRITVGTQVSPDISIYDYSGTIVTPISQKIVPNESGKVITVTNEVTNLIEKVRVLSDNGATLIIEVSYGGNYWFKIYDGTSTGVSQEFNIPDLIESEYGSVPSSFSNQTFDTIGYSNAYIPEIVVNVDADKMVGNTSNLVRMFRTKIPLTENGNRFADSYITQRFRKTNSDNIQFVIHGITNFIRKCRR